LGRASCVEIVIVFINRPFVGGTWIISPIATAERFCFIPNLLTLFPTLQQPWVSQETEVFKAELLATVGHELRGPLTAIKGYAATVLRHERRISRQERHQFLVAIVAASDRLELLVERFPVNVARLAQEALTVAEQRASGHSPGRFTFHLRLKDAFGVPTQDVPIVMADHHRLREVLDNLLENAINYSPQGGAIDIIVRPVASLLPVGEVPDQIKETPASIKDAHLKKAPTVARKAGRVLEICVCDHGIGIPPEHLGRIFDRFHRVDTRLIREVNGLGLGLTMCKRIIELHDGVIWAESCPAEGRNLTMIVAGWRHEFVEYWRLPWL
jgi:signal transduction histidine kinase